jgi:LysM repeat protein
MNNESPLVPQGSFLEQKNQGRARVKIAVFVVLAIHGIGLMALLMQGCQKAPDTNSSASAEQTNAPAPIEESFAPVPPTFVEQSNPAPVVETSTPPVVHSDVPLTPYQEQVTPLTPSTPTPLPTTPGTSLGGATEHKIAKGDTLAGLAKQYKVPWSAIQAANPGVDPSRLQIGQTIQIPPAPPATATAAPLNTSRVDNAASNTYRVRSGDTLLRISKKYGVSVPAIQKANGLRTYRIKVGQELVIPGKNGNQGAPGQ